MEERSPFIRSGVGDSGLDSAIHLLSRRATSWEES
jgi:hypothetical protein